ncbi:T9SS type A sorting domain-containing protein [Hymenobacter sp. ASUV-10]|uniref:T9SS type A sorting domain-containing protein n=1 Tax=Hymenobacter aranciens TaxID=3063996 RepID=A0ABT9BG68_9BACT|nr:T9SS type A sorting domain-containing protein [Hymenobacter sp. ASUV-10]MDO7875651.1 T9SS type A sorting domain-containing protein [Hymenobacter sp. ASUV-10]
MTPLLPPSLLRLTGLALLAGALAAAPARAQVPGWQAVATATNSSLSSIYVPATANVIASTPTSGGDLILVGSFTGTVTFGSTTLSNNVTSGRCTYVARFRPGTNSFVWAVQVNGSAGGTSDNQPAAVAVAGNSIYVAGNFNQSTTNFGSQPYNITGGMGGYVAKLTDTGSSASWTWVQPIRSSSNTAPVTALAVSGTSVYVAGIFNAALHFGSFILNSNLAGSRDLFVGRLTDAGRDVIVDWVEVAVGINGITAQALAVEGTAVYVAGGLAGSGRFGAASIPSGALIPNPYLARLTDTGTSGRFTWASRLGTTNVGTVGSRANQLLHHNGALYAAGTYSVGLVLTGGATLTSAGSTDAFITKLTDTGTGPSVVWALSGGGSGTDTGTSLAAEGPALYLGGTFGGASASFGSRTLLNSGPTTTSDVFLSRLDDAGPSASFAWTLGAGGTGNETAGAVVPLGGFTYLLGSVVPPATFGNVPVLAGVSAQPRAFVATATPTLTATTAALATQVQLFPNPAAGRVRLELPAGPAAVQLRNALGQVVLQRTTASTTLDLRHLPAGVYGLRVALPGGAVTKRLVLE